MKLRNNNYSGCAIGFPLLVGAIILSVVLDYPVFVFLIVVAILYPLFIPVWFWIEDKLEERKKRKHKN